MGDYLLFAAFAAITAGIVNLIRPRAIRDRRLAVAAVVLGVALATVGVAIAGKDQPGAREPAKEQAGSAYEILKGWQPGGAGGYGADVLLKADLDQLSLPDVVGLVKGLGQGRDPVEINVYTSAAAYREGGEAAKKGLLLIYVRGSQAGVHEIRWQQQSGRFGNLYGQVSRL